MGISPDGRPMDTAPFSASKTSNWVARAGGLPNYVRGVAHALLRKGRAKDEAQAISMAVGLMKDWASGRTPNGKGHVHPQVQAAAAAALAKWEAMKASAHAHANEDGAAMSLTWNGVEGIELGAPAVAERVPPGRREGGQFTPAVPLLGRYDTPGQAARAINAMERPQRAAVRATALPPPGFDWQAGDRLTAAGEAL